MFICELAGGAQIEILGNNVPGTSARSYSSFFLIGFWGGGRVGIGLEHVPVFCFFLTSSDWNSISCAGIRGWAMENRVYAEDPFKASGNSDHSFFLLRNL